MQNCGAPTPSRPIRTVPELHTKLDHRKGQASRSRGGPATKVHLAADGRCRPLAFVVKAGQAGDSTSFEAVMAEIRVPAIHIWAAR
ncbi:hypothetical protein GCM10023205_35190 [Yinghuangia aomiensis]|uniref:Transposase DDE domain-containing protein n=1 Tax=Yinghuangia aomiensis TaxID=676205 RepID=A0ABP9HC76_9ACTN